MVSADKLIKVGVKYSDQYFNDLKRIYSNAYRDNDSLEEFLNSTKDYSIGNPLDAGGFNETLTNLIVSSTNDVRFSRPAQKALMQTIIRNTTGELITDVGDDVKNGVRDIVSNGYRNGKLSHTRVASEIESTLDGINNKRARCIARTEIKRAQTTSNYVVARERGANAYKYKCGAKPCDICSVDCGKVFPIDDTEHLPPRHPNCCCGVVFFKDPNLPPVENKPMVEGNVKPTTSKTNIETPYDFDIKDTQEYIDELKEELKDISDKYERMDLEGEIAIYEKDLKSFKSKRKKWIENGGEESRDYVPGYDDIKLDDFPDNTAKDYEITDKVQKKLNSFGKKYSRARNENLQFFTEKSTSPTAHGYNGEVFENGAQKQWLNKHSNEPIHATHNHPRPDDGSSGIEGYTMFSKADFENMVGWNKSRDINMISFSAENQWNRITITKNKFFDSASNKLNKISEAVRDADLIRVRFYDKYHPTITPYLEHTRSVKTKLKSEGVTGKEFDKRMSIAEKEGERLDKILFDERQKNFPKLVEEMNNELNKVGLHIDVEYKV